jgi:hypothetical protein
MLRQYLCADRQERRDELTRDVILAILVAVVAVFITATASAQFGLGSQASPTVSTGGILGCSGGRFVFGQISDSSKDQYMLDTQTGRLWRIGESSDVGTHLRAIPYKDENGKAFPSPGDIIPDEKAKERKKN